MKFSEKFDKVIVGVISGLAFPLLVGLIIYAFSSGHQSIAAYLTRISNSDIITHAISLCVFPNIIIFFLFNQFDMLRATRGVLAMTIVWAVIVFGVKLL
jgi:hypothetical protein